MYTDKLISNTVTNVSVVTLTVTYPQALVGTP